MIYNSHHPPHTEVTPQPGVEKKAFYSCPAPHLSAPTGHLQWCQVRVDCLRWWVLTVAHMGQQDWPTVILIWPSILVWVPKDFQCSSPHGNSVVMIGGVSSWSLKGDPVTAEEVKGSAPPAFIRRPCVGGGHQVKREGQQKPPPRPLDNKSRLLVRDRVWKNVYPSQVLIHHWLDDFKRLSAVFMSCYIDSRVCEGDRPVVECRKIKVESWKSSRQASFKCEVNNPECRPRSISEWLQSTQACHMLICALNIQHSAFYIQCSTCFHNHPTWPSFMSLLFCTQHGMLSLCLLDVA